MDENLLFVSTFRDCFKLKSLTLTGVSANKAVHFGYMFLNCYSLTSLDLSDFTKSAENFITMTAYMFQNCTSLSYVNMTDFFKTRSNVLYSMFSGCNNLQYLNIKDLYEDFWNPNGNNYNNIFENNPQNMVICMPDKAYLLKTLFSKNITCGVIDCSENWKQKQKKINGETGACMNKCSGDFKYEYKTICYRKCPSGTRYNVTQKQCEEYVKPQCKNNKRNPLDF